jgi:hypothetical protein
MSQPGPIPDFRPDGYLPDGIHLATEATILARFGTDRGRRRQLAVQLKRWVELARQVGAHRFAINGSFVTRKVAPGDLDAVILLPGYFKQQLARSVPAAIELEAIFVNRTGGDLFPAESEAVFHGWLDFFSRTREADGRSKGIVEVQL